MKCPSCGAAELVHDTRDTPYTYKRQATIIPAVEGDYCPACDESILDMEETHRVMRAMNDFDRSVNAALVDPAYIAKVRRKLRLDQREAGEIFGGGANAFSRYENGRTLPPVALLKLLRVLDRHPELLDEIRAGADQIGGQGVLQTRSSVARLSESDATKVKQKIAGDPTYAKSILSRAGVLTESGKLAKKYR
ncbi:MAG: type II toxin-antitoxin system MqsA family antitoxin [Burkholderiales bacterium]|nr:type II toxin-antitoxin system MqsA family antitoxin [Burkholderiales bacterium]